MSKSERRTFEISETKEIVFDRDDWVCQVCGAQVTTDNAQLAHIIPQSKANLDRYSKHVIHHPENLLTTCSLGCNNAVQENSRVIQDDIAEKILIGMEEEILSDG